MSHHHPDDMTLVEYSAGNLDLACALAVSVHLSMCGHCREQLRKLNTLGGSLLDSTQPASVEEGSFEALMAHIESSKCATADAVSSAPDEQLPGYRNPLLKYLPTDRWDDLPWSKQTGDIAKYDLTDKLGLGDFEVVLQRIRAGAKVPTHRHQGTELTVIMQGGFSDENGVYHEGDFVSHDVGPEHIHTPRALENEDCICLTVVQAPIQFTKGWHRLLNPFMR
ncbi:ChrR family anti-sigma-E factor [Marinimicrobium alkaliphilum]|uniref:ChrR family anti-sigma-E factor n=1 Tax=Marinimicrobium alkaliphilum TaxID=2202654 RepID=UPI000DB9473B|nr:ChrR family anti-sigma-E factor [Marinimicrobium alkaliphilum]